MNRNRRSRAQPTVIEVDDSQPDDPMQCIDLTQDTEEIVDLTADTSFLDQSVIYEGTHNPRGLTTVIIPDFGSSHPAPSSSSSRQFAQKDTSIIEKPPNEDCVYCPICLENLVTISRSGKQILSTQCGHMFCGSCLEESMKTGKTCPKCRKRLTKKSYHQVYI